MDFKKKLLYKMPIKYYLSDNINASFENFALGLQNAQVDPTHDFGKTTTYLGYNNDHHSRKDNCKHIEVKPWF